MRKDELHAGYMSDEERFADFINGVVFEGKQVVSAEDVTEQDTQTGVMRVNASDAGGTKKQRDILKKLALGTNFIIVGIENQEEVHYLMPLRVMNYDVLEYERQAARIRKQVLEEKGLNAAELMSGFKRESRLMPCVTFVLYYGKEWDGSKDLHGLLDFSGMPRKLKQYVTNYPIHLIEVRKFENTDVFRTDLKLVFDFIKYSDDKEKLKKLVEGNEGYRNMAEDAYDMVLAYTKSEKFISIKDYSEEGGKINMCKALEDIWTDGMLEGRLEGVKGMIFDNIEENTPAERIVQKLKKYFGLEEDEAIQMIAACTGEV